MANNNPPRNAGNAGNAASRTSHSQRGRAGNPGTGPGRTGFYAVLVAVAVIGIGAILYFIRNPAGSTGTGAAANSDYEAFRARYARAGAAQPYTLGSATAPVVVEEFADFECPQCGRYATITEPDVRKRLVEPGQVLYKYYDFPLPMHKNTQAASNAAACANEQGKFWPMHDALFAGQDAWGLGPGETEVTDNPKPVFLGYARAIGLNTDQWEKCFDARKYQPRIDANTAEALRRNVSATPTFYVNGKQFTGSISYDQLKSMVDQAAASPKPAGAGTGSPATPGADPVPPPSPSVE